MSGAQGRNCRAWIVSMPRGRRTTVVRNDIVTEEKAEGPNGVGGRALFQDVERYRTQVRSQRVRVRRQGRRCSASGRLPETIAEPW